MLIQTEFECLFLAQISLLSSVYRLFSAKGGRSRGNSLLLRNELEVVIAQPVTSNICEQKIYS